MTTTKIKIALLTVSTFTVGMAFGSYLTVLYIADAVTK